MSSFQIPSTKTFLAGIAALAAASPAAAAFIVIDDFTETQGPGAGWSLRGSSSVSVETGLGSVLGGTRAVSADWGAAPDPRAGLRLYTGTRFNGPTGALMYSAGAGTPFTARLTYDAGGAGLGLDLSGSDAVSVLFDADHVGFRTPNTLELILSDATSANASSSISLGSGGYSAIGWTDLQFDLAAYATSGIDLTSISSITLSYTGDYSNDAFFDTIGIVSTDASTGGDSGAGTSGGDDVVAQAPIIAPLGLMALGGLGMAAVRRRRRR